jgi:hypothetical protein
VTEGRVPLEDVREYACRKCTRKASTRGMSERDWYVVFNRGLCEHCFLEKVRFDVRGALEPEAEDEWPPEPGPHSRLREVHALDISYWDPREFHHGGRSARTCADPADPLARRLQALTVPGSLFYAGLCLLGDGLAEYSRPRSPGWGTFRYLPSALISFCAAFEALVRLQCEMLVAMIPAVPPPVRLALLEGSEVVDDRGEVRARVARRPALDRYLMLLRYGYGVEVNRGDTWWQNGRLAFDARDAVAHYDVRQLPALSIEQGMQHLEAMLLLLIVPSVQVGRTVFWEQFGLHGTLAELMTLRDTYEIAFEERPLHKDWPSAPFTFPCALLGVDESRYPQG